MSFCRRGVFAVNNKGPLYVQCLSSFIEITVANKEVIVHRTNLFVRDIGKTAMLTQSRQHTINLVLKGGVTGQSLIL